MMHLAKGDCVELLKLYKNSKRKKEKGRGGGVLSDENEWWFYDKDRSWLDNDPCTHELYQKGNAGVEIFPG